MVNPYKAKRRKQLFPPATMTKTRTISQTLLLSKPQKNKRKGNDFGHGTFWNRPANPKRKNICEPKALALHEEQPRPYDLIVDTGASHVLFQQRHMDLLQHVELSHPKRKPFAVLKAANGQILKAIGRGTFRIKQIAVVAYIFRNEYLVHNLLGIAPFADCGCEAVFTATDFNLYHNQDLLLTGKRHSANYNPATYLKSLRTGITYPEPTKNYCSRFAPTRRHSYE